LERIPHRVALMDHAIEADFGCDLQVLLKQSRLRLFVNLLVWNRVGKPMIIQTRLAKSHDLWMCGQRAQTVTQVLGGLVHVRWMPARDREDIFKPFGHDDRPPAALLVRADADDPGDSCRASPLNYLR